MIHIKNLFFNEVVQASCLNLVSINNAFYTVLDTAPTFYDVLIRRLAGEKDAAM